jgi:hypothetical protein
LGSEASNLWILRTILSERSISENSIPEKQNAKR